MRDRMKRGITAVFAALLLLTGCSGRGQIMDGGNTLNSYRQISQEEALEMMQRDRKLRQDWDPVYGDRMQKIVFIGQHLDKKALANLMDDCLA